MDITRWSILKSDWLYSLQIKIKKLYTVSENKPGADLAQISSVQFSSVQLLSHVWLFATPWTTAHQASLSITNSWSLPTLMSTELVMPSSHLILCRPLLLLPPIPPSIRVFSNESTLCKRWPKYWSFSFSSDLPVNIQDWSPLGWMGWISLQSKGLSGVFSNNTVQKHQFFRLCGQNIGFSASTSVLPMNTH